MQIKTTIKQDVFVEIPVPSYWANEFRHLAILDENHGLTCVNWGDQTQVTNLNGQLLESYIGDTQDPSTGFKQISEAEFLEAYDQAIETLTFNPMAKTW